MPNGEDRNGVWRAQLLEPVARLCKQGGLALAAGDFMPERWASPIAALRCAADDDSWDVTVTVVRGRRRDPHQAGSRSAFSRNPDTGYDLDSAGELVYEVRIREDDDGAGGHGPRPLVVFALVADPRAVADQVILWAGRAALFATAPPVADPQARWRRERRQFAHRQAAAANRDVTIGAVPTEAAADIEAIDHAALCWHFPREHNGGYQRSAVVALAGYGEGRPHRRGRWLTARADGDRLALGTDELIPANQRHRWDVTPWLWDRRHANAAAVTRWQVQRPEQATAAVEAIRSGAIDRALADAGVRVDSHLGKLLAGTPHRLARAELAPTWVANLHRGLADVAPWRLAAAHQRWRAGRLALGLPARAPVVLFGLGGVRAARKPKVALDTADDTPILRLIYTAGNAVLPRSLWTVPTDLAAHLYGWSPSPFTPAATTT